MSLDGIRVDHGALERASADLQQAVREIRDRLDRLEADLGPLRGDWTGRAREAYAVAQARWDAAVLQMRDLLAETDASVRQADLAYRDADLRGAARFG